MAKTARFPIWLYATIAIFLVSCAPAPTEIPPATPTSTQIPAAEPIEEPTEPPVAEDVQEEPASVEESQSPALPPDLQPITFETSDGRSLEGTYYPGASNPSPMIVLMHWAPGTMNDWDAIAPWLQNRGLDGGTPGSNDYLDSTWLPALPEDVSFGVLTFNFSGRGNSEGNRNNREHLLLDAQAAMWTAGTQEGVDPQSIVAIGASIGADGVVNGCYLYNQTADAAGNCIGALSLSPGNYLEQDYATHVDGILQVFAGPVYCLAAENDGPSPVTCNSASGENYQAVIFPGIGLHGMDLWRPEIEPDTVGIVMDFLEEVFGIVLN